MLSLALGYEVWIKDPIRQLTHMGDPDLHVWAGVTIFATTALLLRTPLRAPAPILAVAAAAGLNEFLDRLAYGVWREDTSDDLMRTLAIPLAVFAAARIAGLARGGASPG